MDGWIQNNWLEATVAWWLTAEVSHDKSADYYAITGLQLHYKLKRKTVSEKTPPGTFLSASSIAQPQCVVSAEVMPFCSSTAKSKRGAK